jgi:hypothetical protein
MGTPAKDSADRGDDAPASKELGVDGFLPVHHIGELDEARGLGVGDGFSLVGFKALALGINPLGLKGWDRDLGAADEQTVASVEDDLGFVYPTATASDFTRGEDAFTVSGLDECVSGGFPIGSLTPREMSLPPVGTGKAQERQMLMVVSGKADDLLAGVWEVEVDAIVVAEDAERPRLLLDRVWLMQGLGV